MKLLFAFLFAMAALSTNAASVLYTWTPAPQPPLRPGFHRVVASGSFSVDSAVIATGTVKNTDVQNLLFRVSSPANYFYRVFDRGSFLVDPKTGVIIDGGMHGTCPILYGASMYFFPGICFCENVNGGSFKGSWTVTLSP